MKIFPLVRLRAELIKYINRCTINSNDQASELHAIKMLNARSLRFFDDLTSVGQMYDDLSKQHQALVGHVKNLIPQIEIEIINTLQHHTLQKRMQEQFSEETAQPLPDSLIEDDAYVIVHAKLQRHMDWHYPGLIINARIRRWVDCLLTNDPLYLSLARTDTHTKILETLPIELEEANRWTDKDYINKPTSYRYLYIEQHMKDELGNVISSYSDLYRKRVRLYPIMNKDYSGLPQGQFGIILAMDTFNYLNHLEVERYLRECFGLLRPGGTLVFNFWDCDVPRIAEMFDAGTIPYASETWIKQTAKRIGYGAVEFTQFARKTEFLQTVSLAELTKPGTLGTAKQSQSIGRLIEH